MNESALRTSPGQTDIGSGSTVAGPSGESLRATQAGGRLRAPSGGRIDRTRVLSFHFDGRVYSGLQGDTLASALLANGVHLVGRSFKYHRPRGILSAGSEEPNALVSVQRDSARHTPNLRATQVELYDGLVAESQNRWPSLRFDVGALNDAFSRFIPAGFYYKTFMWPRQAWKSIYEPRIRASAGLGVAPNLPDPDRYTNRFAHCDILIVGSGPAGLSAALDASRDGARVILCDEQAELGGSLLSEPDASAETARATRLAGKRPSEWLSAAIGELSARPNVLLLSRTTAFGYFAHNLLALNERVTDHLVSVPPHLPRERTWQVRAREVLLATGAIERPLIFPGNDRPGVMLAGAARTYVNRYAVLPGSRAVILTATDEAYRCALDLRAAGIEIAAIVDTRPAAGDDWTQAARNAGIETHTQSVAVGTTGRLRVSSVQFASVDLHGAPSGGVVSLSCDLVLMSGGFTPTVHLFSQSRGKLSWSEKIKAFVPGESAERVRAVGACQGVFDLQEILGEHTQGANPSRAQSMQASHSAATHLQATQTQATQTQATRTQAAHSLAPPPESAPIAGGGKAFVDWQHDVTTADLRLALREGFRSIEHIKRYTTTGMATDQGKTSNLNALTVVAKETGAQVQQVGFTTYRMPYTPVTFGSFAGLQRGELFDPVRTTPTHSWAAQRGAVFEDVSLWKRARYFPRGGEDMHAAVSRECLAVRNSCGIFDASTLGKIEVVGKDAATFLNRLYVNNFHTLAVGRTRYGILLRDDGFIYDDGVIARLADDRFHVTTTTGGAARVLALMEDYAQTEWADLDVWLTSTTEQWSVIAVQGPNARKALEPLVQDIDMSSSALPHMSIVRGRICGIPMMLFRVSFTGELGFEVNVPADYGLPVWEAIYHSGQSHGMTEYGTESMHVLRAEKGYIIVGQDTDGTVTPDDAGLSWAIGRNKEDFVGKRSLMRPAMNAPDRKQLVGLLPKDPRTLLEEGAQIAPNAAAKPPFRPIGHVTSAYFSPILQRSIALVLVRGGRARSGQTLYVSMPEGDIPVEVTSPVFYDADGSKLHG